MALSGATNWILRYIKTCIQFLLFCVSCFQIKDDQIVITLYKEVARSWVPELSTGGLETQREEEEPT